MLKLRNLKNQSTSLILIPQLLFMRKTLFCLLTIISTQFLLAQKTYIWCGVLIDGISNEPKKNMTIVVEKNKIVAVENGFTKAGAVGVDVDSLTDSKVFEKVVFVMKDGVIYKQQAAF